MSEVTSLELEMCAFCLGRVIQCHAWPLHAAGCLSLISHFGDGHILCPEALMGIHQSFRQCRNLGLVRKPPCVHLHSSQMPAVPMAQSVTFTV